VRSPLNVRIADPGGPLASRNFTATGDPGAWPMTRMITSLLGGDSGVDVRGYRSYRGTEVLGAWQWLPEYAIGLATEQELAEVHSPMGILRRVIWSLLGLLTLGALVLGVGGLRLKRQAGEARLGRRLGQYTLERLIGEGAMGAVYRARHALLRRPTALKLLRPDRNSPQALRRFKKEVQATSQLVHPNTITIFDYGHAPDGTFYYAMEYLRGLTLDVMVTRFGPMPEARVAHILRQVCGSLAEAHEAGLVHRDIKPQNLMLCHRGGVPDMVKVLDFGLVKESGQTDPGLTRDGASVGTPLYMSPEIASASGEIDARSDLYSLGAVAYYLLTAEQPFSGTNAREVMRRHGEERPAAPSERLGRAMNEALEDTVRRCLPKSPASRPQTARELETMLTDVVIPGLDAWSDTEADAWWRAELPELIGLRTDAASDEVPATLTVDVHSRVGND
jgi:serine/threonine protein kinase